MLSPRRIATEGMGGAIRLVAVRGLWPAGELPEPSPESGGGSGPFRRVRLAPREEDETLILVLLG